MDTIGSIKEFNRLEEDWLLYKERLEQYFEANRIDNAKRRVSILLTLLDRETYEILHNFCYPDLLKEKTYNEICTLLEHRFYSKISIFRERMRFYSLRQESDESIIDWHVRIKKASKKCRFQNHLNTIIIDKFITGLYNSKIFDRISEEEFSASKNLNDWMILVLQFERDLINMNQSSQSKSVTSQVLQHKNTREVILNHSDVNYNVKPNNKIENIPKVPNVALSTRNNLFVTKSMRYVRITEQPISSIRFRYACEGRWAGSLLGASSTVEKKTSPSIEVVGYQGKAVVIVSCVTTEKPHRPHPFQLNGKVGCKKGICVMDIPSSSMSLKFSNIGIQCITKKNIQEALQLRKDIRVDPYNTGFFNYKHEGLNLNSVRLCFQVFLENGSNKKIPLDPVVSNPIYDKKMLNELVIVKLSHCVMPADGGSNEIILLCDKVVKGDIEILFYEEINNRIVWKDFGKFDDNQIHKNVALSFKVPPYKNLNIIEPVAVFIQLKRPSDGEASEPLPFQYHPICSELEMVKRKRYEFENNQTKAEYFPKLLLLKQQTDQNNLSQSNQLKDEKESFNDLVSPYHTPASTPAQYFSPNYNQTDYHQNYFLPNMPELQQTPHSMNQYHCNLPSYNTQQPLDINSNQFFIDGEVASSDNRNANQSFNNSSLNLQHQSDDLCNISLDYLEDLNQFSVDQLSDQLLNTLILDL